VDLGRGAQLSRGALRGGDGRLIRGGGEKALLFFFQPGGKNAMGREENDQKRECGARKPRRKGPQRKEREAEGEEVIMYRSS